MEPVKHYDVMVDVESTGTSPDENAIIQLAAVKFNLAEQSIDTNSMFNKCLLIPTRRYWAEDTRTWWAQQKREVLVDIYAKMEDTEKVIREFAEWAGYENYEPLRFWAKPTHFDYAFVQSYFRDYEVMNPFHYRWATDQNSFIRGLAGSSKVEQFKTPSVGGDAHNAIFDCINQINNLFEAVKHYKGEGVEQ